MSQTDTDQLREEIVNEFTTALEQLFEHYFGGDDDTGGDGLNETQVRAIVSEMLADHSGGGGLTEDDVRAIVRDELDDFEFDIDFPDVDGLNETQVRALIEEALDDFEVDIDLPDALDEAAVKLLIAEALEDLDFEGGDVDLSGLADSLRLAYDPDNTHALETGTGNAEHHLFAARPEWGVTFTAEERCHLRGVTVDADGRGDVTVQVLRLSDDGEDADTEPYRERTFYVVAGEQYVPIEVSLEPGHYALLRKSDDGPALRRGDPFDAWDDANDGPAPVTLLRGWNPDWRPRHSDRYATYNERGWAQNYYYFFQPEFGWMD